MSGRRRDAASTRRRPAHWAEPLPDVGVHNLHRIAPHLYRSAQPTRDGMRALEAFGVRTVINLRHFSSDVDRVAGTSLALEEVHIHTWRLRDRHVLRVMRLLHDTRRGPFLIHCWHGADRTGLMSAMYRMLGQGWRREDAIEEFVHGGYGFHKGWRNLIAYLDSVDVDRLRDAIAAPDVTPARPRRR